MSRSGTQRLTLHLVAAALAWAAPAYAGSGSAHLTVSATIVDSCSLGGGTASALSVRCTNGEIATYTVERGSPTGAAAPALLASGSGAIGGRGEGDSDLWQRSQRLAAQYASAPSSSLGSGTLHSRSTEEPLQIATARPGKPEPVVVTINF